MAWDFLLRPLERAASQRQLSTTPCFQPARSSRWPLRQDIKCWTPRRSTGGGIRFTVELEPLSATMDGLTVRGSDSFCKPPKLYEDPQLPIFMETCTRLGNQHQHALLHDLLHDLST